MYIQVEVYKTPSCFAVIFLLMYRVHSQVCDQNPCPGGGMCSDIKNECMCSGNYFGEKCQLYNHCSVRPCLGTSTCGGVASPFGYKCICGDDFMCRMYTTCTNNPCKSNLHTCSDEPGIMTCVCPEGYFGDNCELTNGCSTKQCPSGSTCTWYINPTAFTCTCPETGCDCVSNPCPSGYTCTVLSNPDRYACALCPTGYSGIDCSNYEGCLSNPCFVGYVCSEFSNPDRYICTCPAGYSGNDCSIYSGCLSNPCSNGYVCLVLSNPYRYVCTCPIGYTGRDCGSYDGCLSNPCQHNSTCELYSDLEKYVCACPIGYRGVHCEEFKDPCLDSPCLNNGICETIDGLPHCICEDVFTGEFCEEIVICDSVICNVGGVCINSDKEQSCYYKTEHSVPLYFVVLLVISISVIASLTVYIVYKRISKNKKRVKEPMNDGRDYDAVIKNVMETKSASTFGVIQHSDISDKPSDMTIELKDTTKKDSSYEIPHTYMSIDPQYTDLIK